jgi:hypothetical protein
VSRTLLCESGKDIHLRDKDRIKAGKLFVAQASRLCFSTKDTGGTPVPRIISGPARPIFRTRESIRDEFENLSWRRPSGRCFQSENSGRIPGRIPAPR